MSESATETLRRMLDERGVEWVCYGHENHTWWNGWHAENRPSPNGLFVKVEGVVTPEQAIAATLGKEKAGKKSPPDGGPGPCGQPSDAIVHEVEALGGGKLTAEQVGEAIERNFGKLCVLDDGKPVEWREDWVCRVGIDYKAIADELNAAIGGTCYMSFIDEYEYANGDESYLCECSECGSQTWEPAHDLPLYCRKCGKAVKR